MGGFLVVLAIPNFIKAGGLDITPALLLTTTACVAGTVGGFLWCPWHHYIAKVVMFAFMLPALKFAVDLVLIIIGRWFDPGFGHC